MITTMNRNPMLLWFVLRRHSWRKERNKRHDVAGAGRWHQSPSYRGIAPRGLHHNIWSDVFPYGFDEVAFAAAKIGRPAALGMPGGDFARSLVGLFGQRVAVPDAVGPGDATRPIAIVERLDPT